MLKQGSLFINFTNQIYKQKHPTIKNVNKEQFEFRTKPIRRAHTRAELVTATCALREVMRVNALWGLLLDCGSVGRLFDDL